MSSLLTSVVVHLNRLANAIGTLLAAPMGSIPGWLSSTIIGVITGVVSILAFKYTSNQPAIKRVRSRLNADSLSAKLFKVRSYTTSFIGSGQLLLYSIVPMLVMIVPMTLVMTQLSLWYQSRPLRVGERAIVTLKLRPDTALPLPPVTLASTDACEVVTGPVRVEALREISYDIEAKQLGVHTLTFRVADQEVDKTLTVGDSLGRVSSLRPSWNWTDALLYPAETPLPADSLVQSIAMVYPEHTSWTSGTDRWILYWLGLSVAVGYSLKSVFGVNV